MSVHFPSVPKLQRLKNRRWEKRYVLLEDMYDHRGGKNPRGLITDGTSKPWIVRKTIGFFIKQLGTKTGKAFPAAISHDNRYFLQDKPRRRADLRFYKECRLAGCSKRLSRTYYKALYRYGEKAWKRNQKRPISDFVDFKRMSREDFIEIQAILIKQGRFT